MRTTNQSGHLRSPLHVGEWTIETVYVGSAGHLRRFKVLDAMGRFVPGGLFRTSAEAMNFLHEQRREREGV